MKWDRDEVYVMRLVGSNTVAMWWYEEVPGAFNDGMWRNMRVFSDEWLKDRVWHGDPNVSYGPGSFLKTDWRLVKNPSPVIRDKLADSEWIARV